MVKSDSRGHTTVNIGGDRWVYEDTNTSTARNDRPCAHCGKPDTPEGHDACLGVLPGVENACCGHGIPENAFINFTNGMKIYGFGLTGPDAEKG